MRSKRALAILAGPIGAALLLLFLAVAAGAQTVPDGYHVQLPEFDPCYANNANVFDTCEVFSGGFHIATTNSIKNAQAQVPLANLPDMAGDGYVATDGQVLAYCFDLTLSAQATSFYWIGGMGNPPSGNRSVAVPGESKCFHFNLAPDDLATLNAYAVTNGYAVQNKGNLSGFVSEFVPYNYTAGQTYTIDLALHYLVKGAAPSSSGPIPPSPGANCSFAITNTNTLTNSDGITETAVITQTYTVSANLIANPSFEQQRPDRVAPIDWDPVNLWDQVDWSIPSWWVGSTNARTGSRAVYNSAVFRLYGSPSVVLPSGDYVAGMGTTGTGARLIVGSQIIVSGGGGPAPSYTVVSDTVTLSGGSPHIMLELLQGDGQTYVDDVFLVPIDEGGDLLCLQELYPSPAAPTNGSSGGDATGMINGGIPAPIGGAGTICYQCNTPTSTGAAAVSFWIAWLGCVIRNMFSCSLRVWLYELGNSSRAGVAGLFGLLNWINASATGAVLWGNARAVGMADYLLQFWLWFQEYIATEPRQIAVQVYATINTGGDYATNIWDVLQVLFGLIATLLNGLVDGLTAVLNLGVEIIQALRMATTAPAYDVIAEFEAAGASATGRDSFLWGLMVGDAVLSDYPALWPVVYTAIGLLTIGVFMWLVRSWEELIRIE